MLAYWKRVSSFNTRCVTNRWMNSNFEKVSAALVAICVDRIGDGLRSPTIRAQFFPTTVWSANVRSIGEACPNADTVNFLSEGWWNWTFDIPVDSFSRLKTLTGSTEGGYFIKASASVFLSIPASIEVIRGLGGGTFENAAQMEGFFADRPSLREVCLADLNTRDKSKADIFRVIAERCPHLKSIDISSSNCIDYRGVVALESMKELRITRAVLHEMKIVTICERSPLVEALEFRLRFSSNIDLQSAALNALGALTKLGDLCFNIDWHADVVAPSLVTEFVRNLARNSGASLRCLDLGDKMPLPTAAIEALANGCGKLRHVEFYVRVGEAEPASIRFLIDSIVAHPSWIPQTDHLTLWIKIVPINDGDDEDETEAGMAAFRALAYSAANLPARVELIIGDDY